MSLVDACVPATFAPAAPGTEILTVEANFVSNYTISVPEATRYILPAVEVTGLDFCNATVSYTHPGKDDVVIVETWLPTDRWNERFYGVGGAGFVAGRHPILYANMAGAVADGFAAVTSDAGLGSALDPSEWALLEPGVVDLVKLENLASVTLADKTILGKKAVKDFYGEEPTYSYFNGCSQGGRQALMLAQRYPELYDGIAAGAPANHWSELLPSLYWPTQVMDTTGLVPNECEVDAIIDAAIAACDSLDGAVDGVIGRPDECFDVFDPLSIVGHTGSSGNCTVSTAAAEIVQATWDGLRTADGEITWYGPNPGADLTSNRPTTLDNNPVIDTQCVANGTCTATPNLLGNGWMGLFLSKTPEPRNFYSQAEFDELLKLGKEEYGPIIGTDDPDLRAFQESGGKLITFHGIDDPAIPGRGLRHYYNEVASVSPNIHDFYRLFEVPGLAHCSGGPSRNPTSLFAQLRAWVENGTAPESSPVLLKASDGSVHERIICAYPEQPVLANCEDAAVEECWTCVDLGS